MRKKKTKEFVTKLGGQEEEIQSLHKQMEHQKETRTRQERDRRPYPLRVVEALTHRLADIEYILQEKTGLRDHDDAETCLKEVKEDITELTEPCTSYTLWGELADDENTRKKNRKEF